MVVTVTNGGYIKRVPLSSYRAQRRGGKGRTGMSTRDEDFVKDVFVASTHAIILFFSSRGMVYQLKVYRLPSGSPQARGKAMINLLPLEEGETISTVMMLPENEDSWEHLHVMFSTASGNVRRNSLKDFTNIMANGKIAMKLGDGDQLIRVRTCTEEDDVLLATRLGMCIGFSVSDVRLFSGRTSTGVRGIRLDQDDDVIWMSMLGHVEIETETRDSYLRQANALRRAEGEVDDLNGESYGPSLPLEQFDAVAAREQFVLAATAKGFGKRRSAYDYRTTKRCCKGIVNIDTDKRDDSVVATFPVEPNDQIMLVTDGGQVIRCPVDDVRIASRRTQGVNLFDVEGDAEVVSVARLRDVGGDDDEDELENQDSAVST